MKTPEYTAEHREHREAHDQFLKDNEELFNDMSAFMGQVALVYSKSSSGILLQRVRHDHVELKLRV